MSSAAVHSRVSVSQMSSVRWSLEEDLAFYKASGISSIGVTPYKFADELIGGVEKLIASGVRVTSVLANTLRVSLCTPDDQDSRVLEVLRPSIDVANALGGAPCYFLSGPTPSRMPGDVAYALLIAALPRAVDYARDKGVWLAIETSSTSTRDLGFLSSFSDAVALSRDTGIGICVELQNCWFECRLRQLFEQNVERFVVVQVNDFKIGESSRLNRCVPGDGDMPLEWMLGELLDAGYMGPFELEVLGPKIESEGYTGSIMRGLEWMTVRLDRWGV